MNHNNNLKQTILGAGGAIGTELAKILPQYTSNIRLVARNPKKINETDELMPANLLNREAVFKAVEDSSIVYVLIGFAYNTKVWQQQWVPFIKNVIDACLQYQCKLVFFDNVYALDANQIEHITESSAIHPISKKGKVRAEVDNLILNAIEQQQLQAIIARSPDFFGTTIDKSLLMTMVYQNLLKGKKAQWICNASVIHSMGYTPDLAKGTALLGNTNNAYNQIWNLPVSDQTLTGKEWIELFAHAMQVSAKMQVLPKWAIQTLGIFIPIIKELSEMTYQYDRDYFFDSTKFIKAFEYVPTTNFAAVNEVVNTLKANK